MSENTKKKRGAASLNEQIQKLIDEGFHDEAVDIVANHREGAIKLAFKLVSMAEKEREQNRLPKAIQKKIDAMEKSGKAALAQELREAWIKAQLTE